MRCPRRNRLASTSPGCTQNVKPRPIYKKSRPCCIRWAARRRKLQRKRRLPSRRAPAKTRLPGNPAKAGKPEKHASKGEPVRQIVLFFLLFIAMAAGGQQPTPPPSVAAQDPATEIGQLKKNCPFAHIIGCLQVVFTGQPVHISVGSIAPQNGFAAGLAYVGSHNTVSGNWRNSWNADAVVSPNASWRAGFYMKFVDSRQRDIGI